ncbi:MAG: HEAT repeat domain-containing protein [Polyangia bacterium]
MRERIWTVSLLLALCGSPAAAAGESPSRRVDLANGAVALLEGGELSVVGDGRRPGRISLEVEGGLDPELEAVELSEGRVALHAAVTGAAGARIELVAVREAGGGLSSVWRGRTDLSGDVGERSAEAVRFQDLDGDGAPEIAVGTVVESVRLCGAERLPLLFRRVWDPGTRKLRPVAARRPELGEPREVKGSPDPGREPIEPIIPVLVPAAVSRSAGDRADPLLLPRPGAVVDGDPATAWVPGRGNRSGEFATFELRGGPREIVRLGVRAAPRGEPRRRYDSPRSLLLATGEEVLRLVFPEEAARGEEPTVWFDLPEPRETGCLSLVIEETRDPRPRKLAAISELVAITDIDRPGGLERLATELDDDRGGEQAAELLRALGAKSVAPLRSVWKELGASGRRRAVGVLADVDAAGAADLLVDAAIGSSDPVRRAARKGVELAGDAAVPQLAELLDGDRFEQAAELLFELGSPAALDAFCEAAGDGDRERRRATRSLVARLAAEAEGLAERLWDRIERARESKDGERLLDLLRAGARVPGLAERAAGLAAELLGSAESFADRWRLLSALADSGAPAALDCLLDAIDDQDRQLRAAAARGLGRQAREERVDAALREALGDEAPEVRTAAAEALLLSGRGERAAPELARLASGDPWPHVRLAVVSRAGRLPRETAAAVVAAAVADESESVRLTALEISPAIGGGAIERAIVARLGDGEETFRVRTAAARAAGILCLESAARSLLEVLKLGAEPLAGPRAVTAARAAARALGRIGGRRAQELLREARSRSNPAVERAIEAALEAPGSCRDRGSEDE